MTTVLHIDSSPSGEGSVTRILSASIVSALRATVPGTSFVYRDVAASPPDHLTGELLKVVKFRDLDGLNERQMQELALTDVLVDEFLAADILVIGAPMYNFSIPTQLKSWIDRVIQAGRTFRYTENGPVGLAAGKKAIIASARGGIYSDTEAKRALDHQEAYLRTVLGFVGVRDVAVVRAEGVGMGPDARDNAIAAAQQEIAQLILA